MSEYTDVLEFHKKFGCHIGEKPGFPSTEEEELKLRLVVEEYEELLLGIIHRDLAEIADAIIDLKYVLNGMAISYGIDLDPLWVAVQETNMAKEGGSTRGDGKILKPKGWVAPDIKGLLDKQRSK